MLQPTISFDSPPISHMWPKQSSYRSSRRRHRRGTAIAEFAVVLPFMMALLLFAADFCRIFYFAQVVTNCARNAAAYAIDPFMAKESPYASLDAAARGDADSSFSAQLTVTSTSGSDASGNYVDVTVSYPFSTITGYPGIPSSITITRTMRVRPAPDAPS